MLQAMASPRATLLAVCAVAVLAVAGCDTGDGRDLADPLPGATAPPLVTTTTATAGAVLANPPVGSAESGALALTSLAFAPGQPIPLRYGCYGDNVSPPLSWSGVPAGTVELAISVVDNDAPDAPPGGFVHWAITGLDPSLTGLDEGAVPEGAFEARNDPSESGWYGPCPPAGETRNYVFTLFAFAEPTGVAADANRSDALATMAVTLGFATTLTGTFTGA